MGVAKVCGFLATSVLSFILLIDSFVATLYLLPPELMFVHRYCRKENQIVMRGTYLDNWEEDTQRNKFRINKVFMSPRRMREVIKIHTAAENNCSYSPDDVNVTEFVISARKKRGVIVCLESKPWKKTTDVERSILNQISRKVCSRLITADLQ